MVPYVSGIAGSGTGRSRLSVVDSRVLCVVLLRTQLGVIAKATIARTSSHTPTGN